MSTTVDVGVCNVDHDQSTGMQYRLWLKSLYAILTMVKVNYSHLLSKFVSTLTTVEENGVCNVDHDLSLVI